MPKQVDHDQRRREIAAAVSRVATRRGLVSVSFREVATEAGVSVALVQHYFGTKENLLIGTVNLQSAALGERILRRLADLDEHVRPIDRVRTVAGAFLPDDDDSRAAMVLYHSFAAAALTDPALRNADAFRTAFELTDYISDQLTQARRHGQLAPGVEPATEARTILALILGMSLTVLLDGATPEQAGAAVDAHIARLNTATGRGRDAATRQR